jgi:mono/diheme cytochrome c family protein
MKNLLAAIGVIALLALVGGAVFAYTGVYNVAADDPHWDMTSRLLETVRARSIERRAKDVQVPANLADEQMVLKGAGQYSAMCVGCHLAPGLGRSELSRGLYPAPPELAKARIDPKLSFTVIKHGIKMSGMPAWGGPHGDQQIWNLVAFVNRLPDLSPSEYQQMVRSPAAGAAAAMATHGPAMMAPARRSGPKSPMGTPGEGEHHEGGGER